MILILFSSQSLLATANQSMRFATQYAGDFAAQKAAEENFLSQMEKKMGFPLNFRSYYSGCDMLKAAIEGDFDVASMTPIWMPVLLRDFGYRGILKADVPMSVLLISNRNSPITRVEDLRGKRIGELTPGFTTYMIAERLISEVEGLAKSIEYVGGEFDHLLLSLIRGDIDALFRSGHSMQRIENLPKELKNKLIFTNMLSTNFPSYFIIGKADIDEKRIDSFKDALISMPPMMGYKAKYHAFSESDIYEIENQLEFSDISVCEK